MGKMSGCLLNCLRKCSRSSPSVNPSPSKSDQDDPVPEPDPAESQGDPYANVDATLRGLAGAAEGFGSVSIGGLEGPVYHVTSLDEDGPGSLRYGCRRDQPLWIVFDVSGSIELSSPIRVMSYKTIDGRGQRVKLTGKGLQLKQCEHIIICNLEFEGGRGHDVDAIQIKPNSKNIWIDRCTLADYDDGLIDITRQSTNITISRCHFLRHNKTMLIGADPTNIEDRNIQITIHHCFFDGTRQRHPRVRFGKVHLYNNYTRNWGIYAVCAGVEAQIVSQCNVYEAGSKKKVFEYYAEKALDSDVAVSGSISSDGDIFLNGAEGDARDSTNVFRPDEFYPSWTMGIAGKALIDKVCQIAGWQNVPLPSGS